MRNDLKCITKTMYDIQDFRKRLEGRLGLKSNGDQKKNFDELGKLEEETMQALNILYEQLKDHEKKLERLQKKIIDNHFPFGKVLVEYPGIGYKLAGVILSEIDIAEGSTVSKLWRFCGLDPTAKSKKGEINKYNKFLKTKILGVFGYMEVIRKSHPMRPFYDTRKMRRESQGWGNSKNHRHKDAIRYAVKMWIETWLYPTWRKFEGLPVREPYREEYLGKKHNVA